MRTTLTLEPDVAQKLKARMNDQGVTLKQAVNEALRRGLATETKARKPYKIKPWALGLKPGLDPNKLGQHLDQLDAEEFHRKFNK